MYRAHLIGNGTDAANACGDVRNVFERTAAKQCFEKARRFENVKMHSIDRAIAKTNVKPALAFDPSHCFHLNRSHTASIARIIHRLLPHWHRFDFRCDRFRRETRLRSR